MYPQEISSPSEPTVKGDAVNAQTEGPQSFTDQLPQTPSEVPPARQPMRAAASKTIDWVRGWIAALDGDDDQFVDQYNRTEHYLIVFYIM